MKYIIIENEVLAQKNLCNLVQQLQPKWKIEALFNDIDPAVNWINMNNQPDLVFLNVQFFGNKSLSKLNQSCNQSSIIFTTSSMGSDSSIFDSNQIDYLQKPVKQNTLKPLLTKYDNLNGNKLSCRKDITEVAKLIKPDLSHYVEKYIINVAGKTKEIRMSEVAYFYSMNKISFVVTENKREYILDGSLEKIEKEIDPKIFFRTNRQTICSRNAIKVCESWFNGKFLIVTAPEYSDKIIISREKAKEFKVWWQK